MKFSLLLPVLAASQAYTRLIVRHGGGDNSASSLESRGGHISLNPIVFQSSHPEKRAIRSKCSAPVYNGDAKRDFTRILEPRFMLSRRTMSLPIGSDMDSFMKEELASPSVRPIIWNKHILGEPQDMATSDFEEFGNNAFSYGTAGLCGCTTLIVVSRKALYFAHYWENISFAPDTNWMDKYKTADKAFEQTVIKGLQQGVGKGNNQEQVSLKNQAAKIDDDTIHAFLMIPTETYDDRPDGYRANWNRIKSTVGDLIPKLKYQARWKEIPYDALDNDDKRLEFTARGKILFKFDPKHNNKKKATVWIEENSVPVYDDEW